MFSVVKDWVAVKNAGYPTFLHGLEEVAQD